MHALLKRTSVVFCHSQSQCQQKEGPEGEEPLLNKMANHWMSTRDLMKVCVYVCFCVCVCVCVCVCACVCVSLCDVQ